MAGGEGKLLDLKLRVWRQKGPDAPGAFAEYELKGITTEMSFLEMLDVLNNKLIHEGKDPVEFDSDCREGICGSCGCVVDGNPHGPDKGTTVCQLHMRRFETGATITVEPFRANSFPVLRDLVVDRSAFDRIIAAGGFVSVNTGSVPDASAVLVAKHKSDEAFDAAACIGCGACVASCKNASGMLFTSAKVSQLALLPQGDPERERRVLGMVRQHDDEGFGACTNTGACEASCPKEISLDHIARLNREYMRAMLCYSEKKVAGGV